MLKTLPYGALALLTAAYFLNAVTWTNQYGFDAITPHPVPACGAVAIAFCVCYLLKIAMRLNEHLDRVLRNMILYPLGMGVFISMACILTGASSMMAGSYDDIAPVLRLGIGAGIIAFFVTFMVNIVRLMNNKLRISVRQ